MPTPALAVYPDIVDQNIATTIRLLGGNPNRWRPHVKSANLGFIMNTLIRNGVNNFKCTTTVELLGACQAGARDVLVSYPIVGANANRVREIAAMTPEAKISALVDSSNHIANWIGSEVGLFIDINPGTNFTGIQQDRPEEVIKLATSIVREGLTFRGLHYYDGYLSGYDLKKRGQVARRGYDGLVKLVDAIEQSGMLVPEVVTAGTPAFPYALSYEGFSHSQFIHRASPGSVIYADCASLSHLPIEYEYRPAAIVVSTIVSYQSTNCVICDAGHRAISVAQGNPTCIVLGRPAYTPLQPSADRLPIEVVSGSGVPHIGDQILLVPRHASSTINNFHEATLVCRNRILRVEEVTARSRENPLVGTQF